MRGEARLGGDSRLVLCSGLRAGHPVAPRSLAMLRRWRRAARFRWEVILCGPGPAPALPCWYFVTRTPLTLAPHRRNPPREAKDVVRAAGFHACPVHRFERYPERSARLASGCSCRHRGGWGGRVGGGHGIGAQCGDDGCCQQVDRSNRRGDGTRLLRSESPSECNVAPRYLNAIIFLSRLPGCSARVVGLTAGSGRLGRL